MKKRSIGLLLVLCMVASLFVAGIQPAAVADAQPIDQAIVQGGNILHCYNWSYDEITANIDAIAAAGYVAVQTSPVQQPKDYNAAWWDEPGNWWKLYQPMGLRIAPTVNGKATSWLGTKEDLTELCDAAEQKGVYVIVDIVANHVANKTGGGAWDQVNPNIDAELYNQDYFHTSTAGVNDDSRWDMTQNQMGMPDLNTGNEAVQEKVLRLLKECVDCGVDGFRFDAAKHIELPGDDGCGSNFWPYVLNGIRDYAGANNLFIYGESLSGSGSDSWVNEYITYMALTDSQAGNRARGAVVDQNAGELAINTYTRGNSPKSYVLWAESHDTYEDGYAGGGSRGVQSDNIVRTWAIVGARADSTGLYLARPNEAMGKASDDLTWKSPAVAAVNKFKNHYKGTGEWFTSDQAAMVTWIERGTNGGDAGVSIVKLDGAGSVNLDAHLMSSGCYLDEITGNVFTVSGGKISGTVGPTGVAVVYQPTAAPSAPPSPSTEPTTRTLYLKPNSNWKMADARFAMYSWGSGTHWTDMTRVDGETEDIYEAELPSGDTTVIFVRMNPANSDNNWSNRWNQTGDLAVPSDKNLFTLAEGVWDGATTTWSAYGDVGGGDPTPVTEDAGYYLVGTMTGWSLNPAYKITTRTAAETEEYMIDVDLLRAKLTDPEDHKFQYTQFKVVYSADGIIKTNWYPSGFGNEYGAYDGEIPETGRYTVYFRPNGDGDDDWHDHVIYATPKGYHVKVNDADKNGTVTVSKDVEAEGNTVTVTVTPSEGYALDTLTYSYETHPLYDDNTMITTDIKEAKQFTMPAHNVEVKATFVEIPATVPTLRSHSLTLGEEIGVKFLMELPYIDGVDYSTSYMDFTISGKGADNLATKTVNYNADNVENNKYVFECKVNALQMADKITATFHYGEGQTVSAGTYSVKEYVNQWEYEAAPELPDSSGKTKITALVHALADYGHYVQIFLSSINNWEINTGTEPDNNKYAQMMKDPYTTEYDVDEIKGITTTDPYQMTVAGSDAFKAPSMSLVLDSETAIRIFLAHADGSKLNANDVTVTVTPATGVAWDAQTQLQKTQKGNRVMVEIRGVKAAWLAEKFTITATEGADTQTIGVCALTYVGKLLASEAYAENTAAQNAVCALYAYAMAAKDFIN